MMAPPMTLVGAPLSRHGDSHGASWLKPSTLMALRLRLVRARFARKGAILRERTAPMSPKAPTSEARPRPLPPHRPTPPRESPAHPPSSLLPSVSRTRPSGTFPRARASSPYPTRRSALPSPSPTPPSTTKARPSTTLAHPRRPPPLGLFGMRTPANDAEAPLPPEDASLPTLDAPSSPQAAGLPVTRALTKVILAKKATQDVSKMAAARLDAVRVGVAQNRPVFLVRPP